MYMEFVKIQHTAFALPFAYSGAFMSARGVPDLRALILILVAFTGLRTFSMAMNNLADRKFDSLNPRTSDRPLPSGKMSLKEVYGLMAISVLFYELSAYMLNMTCFILSPVPVLTSIIYPYLKRYTPLSHFVLGLTLAYAPPGGWIAISDSFHPLTSDLPPFLIGAGVLFWVAGFDIIYAIQDVEFDRRMSLHSIPADFGIKNSLSVSSLSHFLTIFFFALAHLVYPFGMLYVAGLIVISGLLFAEHAILSPENVDEKRIRVAFFNINAMVSFVMLASIFLDVIF